MIKNWCKKTPNHFRFTAKFPKVITHDKRLKDVEKELELFFSSMIYLEDKILALLIRGAAMNAECKLMRHEEFGDHIMFVGEIMEITADEKIKPLVYHNGMYWKLGNLSSPRQEILDGIKHLVEKYEKGSNNKSIQT